MDIKRKRIIFHIDVNSAFLSWEAVNRLNSGESIDLRTIPSIVGGDVTKRHGIVLAKSIPAKKYGIRTAEPIYQALKKCPQLVIIPTSHGLYVESSQAMVNILRGYTPILEKFSIDECFMDMTGSEMLFGNDYNKLANRIKEQIKTELGFTVNIGISTNKLLAKMASDMEKPDKIHTLFPEEIENKMWPMPVCELFMVGGSSAKKLDVLGIKTIGDLASTDVETLKYHFKKYGRMMWEYANGHDSSAIESESDGIKDMSNETTTSFDIVHRDMAHLLLLSLCETIGTRLRKQGKKAWVIGVHLKDKSFQSMSRQKKLANPTNNTMELFERLCGLFDELWKNEPIRLLGVRATQLTENQIYQASFFDPCEEVLLKKSKLDCGIDKIREKYGNDSLVRASLLSSKNHDN